MSRHGFLDSFAGLPVRRWDEGVPEDPAAVAWWINEGYGERRFTEIFEQMLAAAGPDGPAALIVGDWGDPHHEPFPVGLLTGNADRLGALRALFIGEISSEECEMSWIRQGDITPLLETFPRLQHLWVRGSQGLALRPVRHERLHELVLQSGGLPAEMARAVAPGDGAAAGRRSARCDRPRRRRAERTGMGPVHRGQRVIRPHLRGGQQRPRSSHCWVQPGSEPCVQYRAFHRCTPSPDLGPDGSPYRLRSCLTVFPPV
ncbi:hypothetical protein SAMN05421541_104201 [Actinoplanes philippinensis]|uniref:Uncharacterized protein n=1 Tax=Actinoplanes philippinensis TaxID=35752 RepID=A0A1I2E738_9ACTN|nr:hypothetical protein SAMN05421541_104201 [Actinoplanes philippinensis]